MTLKFIADTIETFISQYKDSVDPEIRKVCGFLRNTVDIINAYIRFFQRQKARIERSQEYYAGALEDINSVLGDESSVSDDSTEQLHLLPDTNSVDPSTIDNYLG